MAAPSPPYPTPGGNPLGPPGPLSIPGRRRTPWAASLLSRSRFRKTKTMLGQIIETEWPSLSRIVAIPHPRRVGPRDPQAPRPRSLIAPCRWRRLTNDPPNKTRASARAAQETEGPSRKLHGRNANSTRCRPSGTTSPRKSPLTRIGRCQRPSTAAHQPGWKLSETTSNCLAGASLTIFRCPGCSASSSAVLTSPGGRSSASETTAVVSGSISSSVRPGASLATARATRRT